MEFHLKITLGNEAMRDGDDIAAALDLVSDDLRRFDATTGDSGRVRDVNGNTVGEWKVVE